MIRLPLLLLLFSPSLALGQKEYFGGPQGRVKRQMSKLNTKWTNGQVNYEYSGTQEGAKEVITTAMNYIANRTCITFSENPSAAQKIVINLSPGACNSKLGAPGTNSNPTGWAYLQYGACSPRLSTAVHELSHSLGAIHEHQRPERDDFLWINQSAIDSAGRSNEFIRSDLRLVPTLVPFEHGSVMGYQVGYYEPRVFGTWDPDYDYTFGNQRISYLDMYKINEYYNCWSRCPTALPCANQGRTNPSNCNVCLCTKGWFGKLCDERQPGSLTLNAKSQWQNQSITFNYQPTSDNYKGYYSTYTYINAPFGATVQVKVEKMDAFACVTGCGIQGIEIKTKVLANGDNRITSPILCCDDASRQQMRTKTFESKQLPTIIDTYSQYTSPSTVVISYRYEMGRFG